MDEKENTGKEGAEDSEKNKQEITTPNNDEGGESKTITDLDRAEQVVERRERVAAREEKLQRDKEAFAARKTVGGVTEAGQQAPEKKKETNKEYRTRVEKEMAEGKTEFGD